MKYQFPIRIPLGWKLTITQGFHANHNGNDVVAGDGPMTYGIPLVWTFPWVGTVYKSVVDNPIGALATKASAQVDCVDPDTGTSYSVIYIHLSGATFYQPYGAPQNIFKQGDVVGYIGNGGWVNPKPTVEKPFGGSHLHLGLGVKKVGELNFTMVDPSLYFDINDPWRGADDPSRDQVVYDWQKAQGGGKLPPPFLSPQIPTPPQTFKFNNNLWFGINNTDVLELQKRLGVDYSTGPGNFGPRTFSAVVQYQKAHGISPTGFVGPITRASLNR